MFGVFYHSIVSRGILTTTNYDHSVSRDHTARLLHLLYDIKVMWRKTIEHAFSMFNTLIKHGLLTNQRANRVLSILLVVITDYKVRSMLHGSLEGVVIVKRNMEENIEQGKMK